MKVRLKESSEMLRKHGRSIPPQATPTKEWHNWGNILRAVGGMELEVETEHLFEDQFNTGPIPGVSDLGIRVMYSMVEEIIDDVRPAAVKCDYCGRCQLNVPDEGVGQACGRCEKGVMRRLVIKPVSRRGS